MPLSPWVHYLDGFINNHTSADHSGTFAFLRHTAKSSLFDAFAIISYSVLYRIDATFLSLTEKFKSAEFNKSFFTSSSPSENTFDREIASTLKFFKSSKVTSGLVSLITLFCLFNSFSAVFNSSIFASYAS